jgi:CRISPR-associated protein Cas5t
MLCIEIDAPFATCRTFAAGWYRPTATFLTPSAVYGLLLNIAGIESRLPEEHPDHDGKTASTLTAAGLPPVTLAIGVRANCKGLDAALPIVQTIYQQLHNYPVGKDAGIDRRLTRGAKNNITPVRREFLSDVRALVCLEGNKKLEDRIRNGLAGRLDVVRYGLPFLGDNQFLVDRLEEVKLDDSCRAHWYERIDEMAGTGPRRHTTRLTIWINRADLSKTVSALYAPQIDPTTEPPPQAWTAISPP